MTSAVRRSSRSSATSGRLTARVVTVSLVAGLGLAGLRLPSVAHAQAPGQDLGLVEKAKEHFGRGVAFYKSGSLDAALAEFNKAYELQPNFKVLYNIAQVQSERQDHVAAIQAFRQYLADGGSEISLSRRTSVEDAVQTQLGQVGEVVVSTNASNGELLVDGVVAAKLPASKPIMVNAGIREITVRSDGRTAIPRRVTLAGGETVRLDFPFEKQAGPPSLSADSPLPADAPSAPAAAEDRPVPARAWVAFAMAGVCAGGAVSFGLLAHKADGDLDTELGKFPGDRAAIDHDRSRLRLFAGLTDGLAVASVLSATLGVYFAVTRNQGLEQKTASTDVHLVLAGSGLGLAGRF